MALSKDGRILGVRDWFLCDTGAYDPYGLTIPINTQCTLLGPYDIPNYDSEFTSVFTNKPIVTPVRGAGRQHGVFVSERLLDLAARELGIDRVEIRKRNLLGPDRFPHNHEIMFQDSAPLVYDSGNYLPTLEQAAEIIGYDAFLRDEQPRLRAQGKSVGVGIACYVEGTGIGPYEGARVTVEPSGTVRVATGVGTQGQGHFTVLAQIVADALGVGVEDVRVVTGDTREFHWGTGTFASRGAVVAGSACHAAAMSVRGKILDLAGAVLGVAVEKLELGGGRVKVAGTDSPGITIGRSRGKGESASRRRSSWNRARPREHGVLRPGSRQHRERRPRHDRRGRSGNGGGRNQAVPRRPRLRHHHQSAARRRADSRRRGARHRQRVLRTAGLRRAGTAHERIVHGLSVADGDRRAADRDRASGDAIAVQCARTERRRAKQAAFRPARCSRRPSRTRLASKPASRLRKSP